MVALPSLLLLAVFSTAVYSNAIFGGRPFLTPRAAMQRYWQNHVSTTSPVPEFLLNKASPLTASDYALFSHLAGRKSLRSFLPDLCKKANLVCIFPEHSPSLYVLNGCGGSGGGSFSLEYSFSYISCDESPTLDDKKFKNQSIHGLFFREASLKPYTIMPMPEVAGNMLVSSFLPRSISSEFPFSIPELKQIFHADDNSSRMSTVISNSVGECRQPPSSGEMKRCVTSAEDMIDFAISVLGRNVEVRAMAEGVSGDVSLKALKPVAGGRVTNAVSCHRRLFPLLLYYCHAIPNVRVYEAEIVKMKKIIQGTTICHLDTSSWTPGHEAFKVLGSGPGKIEMCHWIFGDDMIWTAAD